MKWTWNKELYDDIYLGREYAPPVEVELPDNIAKIEKHEALYIIRETLDKFGYRLDDVAKIEFDEDMIHVYDNVIIRYDEDEFVYLGYFKAC